MPNVSPAVAAPESFAALFEESLSRKEMRIGEVITAEVVRIDQNFVVVNAGLKSESFILLEEFRNDAGELDIKPGDFVPVAIEALEDGHGETRLSRDKAKAEQRAAHLDHHRAGSAGCAVAFLFHQCRDPEYIWFDQ
jgi:small subunit ribosomal protein S1